MSKIKFSDLKNYFGREIVLEGFVDRIRDLQYVQFMVIRDITGKVQVTIEKNEENIELNNIVSNLTLVGALIKSIIPTKLVSLVITNKIIATTKNTNDNNEPIGSFSNN